ncbi:unnamed protein product [Hydatigera taeniaeformis]|uniref:Tissue factor pathway inhibitor n=1 Tax=Hydatigena taeniaeformis TaxID=6205 RepID=A0A0R3WQS2_HYDTA|nr:unnamed protein product [Hydatigera taeniaeformis]
MAETRYEEVNYSKQHGKSSCCLKFWLAFFVIVSLALIGVVLWLLLAPNSASDLNARSRAALQTASGTNRPGLCALPPAQGPCKATIWRYYFDATSGECKKFIYGGCSGNANNFISIQECMNTCMLLPGSKSSNMIIILIERPKPKFCRLEMDPGPCFGAILRYAYDEKLGKCVEFAYGGCDGNANNFETLEECERKCVGELEPGTSSDGGISAVDTTLCHLPHDPGNCYAHIQRWAFDANSGQCVQFIYGGCGGNANNFETKEACERRCLANIPLARPATGDDGLPDAVCSLPAEVGPCRGALKRWYYDVSKGQCTEFVYGGCRGNANNFESKEACEARCSGELSPPPSSLFYSLTNFLSTNFFPTV